jgi:hypothetical protein
MYRNAHVAGDAARWAEWTALLTSPTKDMISLKETLLEHGIILDLATQGQIKGWGTARASAASTYDIPEPSN